MRDKVVLQWMAAVCMIGPLITARFLNIEELALKHTAIITGCVSIDTRKY